MFVTESSWSRENKNVLSLVLNREVYEIERREEGRLFHVRGACIEKALSCGDERLMRTFVWSLNLFNTRCGYLLVLG